MPRAGHIRARLLRKMLHAGLPAPSSDGLHLCNVRRPVSVTTKRRSLLLTVLPAMGAPRCSVCERRFVKRRRRDAGAVVCFEEPAAGCSRQLLQPLHNLRPAQYLCCAPAPVTHPGGPGLCRRRRAADRVRTNIIAMLSFVRRLPRRKFIDGGDLLMIRRRELMRALAARWHGRWRYGRSSGRCP
jgi:hypothetical protein